MRTPLTWIHFLMLQTSWIRFGYPFKHNKSFTPRQLVMQITVYGMMRENTTSQRQSLAKFKKKSLTLVGTELITEHTAQSLGVILDTSLTYEEYIPKNASSWVSSLSQIRQTKHTFDKCPLLTTFKHNVSKLQSMLNFVAQIVSKICKYDHITAVLKEL